MYVCMYVWMVVFSWSNSDDSYEHAGEAYSEKKSSVGDRKTNMIWQWMFIHGEQYISRYQIFPKTFI